MIKNIFQRIGNPPFAAGETLPVDLKPLEKILRYTFKNKKLLLLAVKHRSYLSLTNENDYSSNERLELLGDAVLELIATEFLYHRFETEDEGVLSQKRSVLVSRQVLGKIAAEMQLGNFLLLNKGEEKTGGRTRPSNLANLFEAVLGAVYLDGGYKAAQKFVSVFVLNQMDELLHHESNFNYKSALLEFSQAKGWGTPKYNVLKETGPDHKKQFRISVELPDDHTAQGSGSSKKKAEQQAAAELLRHLQQEETASKSEKSG